MDWCGWFPQILQLVLEEEVSPDSCSVKRSQTTGHLLLYLQKAKLYLHPHRNKPSSREISKENPPTKTLEARGAVEKQIQRVLSKKQDQSSVNLLPSGQTTITPASRPTNTDTNFTDDTDVPPLI